MADRDYPNLKHPSVQAVADALHLVRDLAGGTRAMWDHSQRYIPQGTNENTRDYKRRAQTTALYNAFERSCDGMTGLVMSSDPELDVDDTTVIGQHWEDIDLQGTTGPVFAKRLFRDGLESGLNAIMVEFPRVDQATTLTRQQEKDLGVRPYWIHIRREEIVTWRYTVENGKTVFSLLVLQESVEEADGAFGIVIVHTFRVFRRTVLAKNPIITVELWRQDTPNKPPQLVPDSRVIIAKQTEIPVVIIGYGNQVASSMMTTRPPLLALGEINLSHWVKSSELSWLGHLGCVPIPVRKGYNKMEEGEEMAIGPATLQDLPIGGDFYYAEIKGVAFAHMRDMIKDDEDRMAQLGMAFLMHQQGRAETAEAKRLDATAQNASLATAAVALEEGLDHALDLHGAYLGDADGPNVSINREFEEIIMAVTDMTEYRNMQIGGQISLELYWDILESGKRLPPGFDREKERLALAQEAAAAAAAVDPAAAPPGGAKPPDGPGKGVGDGAGGGGQHSKDGLPAAA